MDDTARQDQADVEQLSSLPEENQNNEVAEATDSQSTLPDGVSERTKEQFDKLLEANKRLKAELDAKSASKKTIVDDLYPQKQVVNPSQYQNLTQQQVANTTKSFVDEEGYVDVATLNSELERLNREVYNAQQAALLTRQEVERSQQDAEMRKAHSLYPQLDPENAQFDKGFYDMVKNHVLGQMYEYGRGSLLTAAESVAKLMKIGESNVKAEKEREAEIQKRDTATQAGNSARRPSNNQQDFDELRRRSLAGDMDAITARLKASGY